LHQNSAKEQYFQYLDRDELIPALESLENFSGRPILLPEKMSLSQDFLFAAGAIARVWSSMKGQTVVKPVNPGELHQQ